MTMTVKLAPDLEQRLRQRSRRLGQPASVLIRQALSDYLDAPQSEPASAYELGVDVFGKHAGDAALASQRKQLAAEAWSEKHSARSPSTSTSTSKRKHG